MNNDRDWFEYKLPEGSVFVQVRAALRTTESRLDGSNREVFKHCVTVGTTRSPFGEDKGFVSIRGRQYEIAPTAFRRMPAGTKDWRGEEYRWEMGSEPYGGTYRNSAGSELDYKAKTRDRLREIAKVALDMFEKDHPDWSKASELLYLEHQMESWTDKASKARKEMEAAEAEVAELLHRISIYSHVC
ncbi:hypothetical protein [Streptodolium elevatio]|uniref:Uncharacterized protein n=1 Tax=Streptodolium elevatio TaxID=3157996 RepID=A0ABV3DBZ0_9ACTN